MGPQPHKKKNRENILFYNINDYFFLTSLVFDVFLFCGLSRKAVFNMGVREGKFTCVR